MFVLRSDNKQIFYNCDCNTFIRMVTDDKNDIGTPKIRNDFLK